MKGLFKFFVDICLIVFVVVIIFSTRNVYGKFFPNEKDKARLGITNQNNNSNNDTNTNKNNTKTNTTQTNDDNKTKNVSKKELDTKFYELMTKYKNEKNQVSFIYDNLKTGYRYAYDANRSYTAASTTKVIYALYFYDEINSGKFKLDTPISYKESNYEEGAGNITNDANKKNSYPLQDVLKNMLVYSDNTATKMLTNNYEDIAKIKADVFKKIGIKYQNKDLKDNIITPQTMEQVWLYLYKNKDKYKSLIDYLKEGETYSTGAIDGKEIASKYGAIHTYNHENAIVFGKEDYLIIIYTNNLAHAKEEIKQMVTDIDNITENRN